MSRPPRPRLSRALPLAARSLPLRTTTRPRPLTAGLPADDGLLDSAVDWAVYRDGVRQPYDDFYAGVEAAAEPGCFLWIGLHDPTIVQLEQLGEVFGLHHLALEDAATPRQRPKMERYDDSIFVAMRTLAYIADVTPDEAGGDIVETGAIMVFLGEHFVATVRHGPHASMIGMRHRLEKDAEHLALGPSAVLHAVADKVVDDYLAVVDAVQIDIEEIETKVFSPRAGSEIERLYQLKRDVIEMKRTVTPLARPLNELAERPRRLVHPEIREYLRDVEDHLSRVREQVVSYDELLSSMLQAGLARLSVSENEDMRKISAWVAIAAVPTMIAGIYGMNFQFMPETEVKGAYYAVLALMGGVCGAMFRGFKRNGWL